MSDLAYHQIRKFFALAAYPYIQESMRFGTYAGFFSPNPEHAELTLMVDAYTLGPQGRSVCIVGMPYEGVEAITGIPSHRTVAMQTVLRELDEFTTWIPDLRDARVIGTVAGIFYFSFTISNEGFMTPTVFDNDPRLVDPQNYIAFPTIIKLAPNAGTLKAVLVDVVQSLQTWKHHNITFTTTNDEEAAKAGPGPMVVASQTQKQPTDSLDLPWVHNSPAPNIVEILEAQANRSEYTGEPSHEFNLISETFRRMIK